MCHLDRTRIIKLYSSSAAVGSQGLSCILCVRLEVLLWEVGGRAVTEFWTGGVDGGSAEAVSVIRHDCWFVLWMHHFFKKKKIQSCRFYVDHHWTAVWIQCIRALVRVLIPCFCLLFFSPIWFPLYDFPFILCNNLLSLVYTHDGLCSSICHVFWKRFKLCEGV